MINSSKQLIESKMLHGNIGLAEINDDMEALDLQRIASDIEKLICDDENFENSFGGKFEEFQEENETKDYTKDLSTAHSNSNNNSMLCHGNIWLNDNEKGDDSVILVEKFENLKNSNIQRKYNKRAGGEDFYALKNQFIFNHEKNNFCNLTQSKNFEKVIYFL